MGSIFLEPHSHWMLNFSAPLSICPSKPDVISRLSSKISCTHGRLRLFSNLIRALIPSSENKQRSNVDRGVALLGDAGFFPLSILLAWVVCTISRFTLYTKDAIMWCVLVCSQDLANQLFWDKKICDSGGNGVLLAGVGQSPVDLIGHGPHQ